MNIKELEGKKLFREMQISRETLDEKERTLNLSFSSNDPYLRSWGWEILSHDPGHIRMDRLSKNAPLLLNHDTEKQIGAVKQAVISEVEQKGRALVRFSKSALGEEIYQDVIDEIRTSVSVGYVIHQVEEVKKVDGKKAFKVVDWEPLEISIVPVPADITVGVGRNQEIIENEEVTSMETKNAPTAPVVEVVKVNEDAIRKDAQNTEHKRMDEILAVADQFGMQKEAREYLTSGKSIEEFKNFVLEKVSNAKPVATQSTEIGLSTKEKRDFSMIRAVEASMKNDWSKAGLELEASKAVEQKFNKQAKGFYIPFDILNRDVDYDTEGTDLVQTTLLGSSFIELLYKKSIVKALGATSLDGIVGNIDIPRMSGGATVYWQTAENTEVTESTPTFDKVSLTPKSMGAIVDVSKLLLNQSSMSVENMLINDMTTAIAIAVDTAAINGTGLTGQPTGLLNSSINDGNITTSTGLTYADVVNLETLVATDDADFGALAYLTSAKVRGYLKSNPINATYGDRMMWQNEKAGEGSLNGYRSVASNVVPDTLDTNHSGLIFGNWSDLILCYFAPGLDVMVDPYSGAKNRLVSLICYMDIDVGVRHLESFASAENILIS